ncbi:MAG: cytochrome C oxidase subunit IV family protein, partial [Polyangiaceae bacterium]
MSTESAHAHAADSHGNADDGAVHPHPSSVPFSIAIFLALCALTVLTVKVSYYDFGAANIVIALLIATAKGSLVAT